MCLITFQSTPKVADKDIICYKFLRKEEHKEVSIPTYYTYHSIFFKQNEIWPLNEVCTSRLIYDREKGLVRDAFHSFKKLTDAQKEAKHYLDVVVAKCIIPENARYYEGANLSMSLTDGYASDKIKIVEIIEV
jgi:hypothetical protein